MTILRAGGRAVAMVFAVSGLAGATAAQTGAPSRAALIQKLADCRRIAEDGPRLACYDAAAGALDQAEAKGDIVVVDREQAKAVHRQAFGFTLPSLSMFDRGGRPDEVDRVSLKVESATQGGDGKWVLRLEGGQVWRQIDTDDIGRPPRTGATVTIKKAALGSYKLSTGGGAAIRVHRDN